MPDIAELAIWINERAKTMIVDEGTHAPMFFLVTSDGRVQPQLVEAGSRDEMPEALAEIAASAKRERAVAVVVVGEAWAAPRHAVPAEGVAESLHAHDILLVAALDVDGNETALQTPIERFDDQRVAVGETTESDIRTALLDPVRRLWGLRPSD